MMLRNLPSLRFHVLCKVVVILGMGLIWITGFPTNFTDWVNTNHPFGLGTTQFLYSEEEGLACATIRPDRDPAERNFKSCVPARVQKKYGIKPLLNQKAVFLSAFQLDHRWHLSGQEPTEVDLAHRLRPHRHHYPLYKHRWEEFH
jgi:hypothetical protein